MTADGRQRPSLMTVKGCMQLLSKNGFRYGFRRPSCNTQAIIDVRQPENHCTTILLDKKNIILAVPVTHMPLSRQ